MCATSSRASRWSAIALRTVIGVLGVVAIVGSGGGMPDVDLRGCCAVPSASIQPALRTVAVGDSATFRADVFYANAPVTYQWRRNGTDIVGATGTSYTLVGANLGDDGAQFSIHVSASNGTTSAVATLQVSPLPAILHQDGDFGLAGWSVAALPIPAQGGPTQTVSRVDSGGNPDAYRSILYQMTAGPSSITVFHIASAATHDPATQGAVYAIDAELDCLKTGSGEANVAVLLEQGSRRYVAAQAGCAPIWTKAIAQPSLRASDFTLADGPACAAGETCPNFSVGGAPLRLGFASVARTAPGEPAATYVQGIDNWKLSIWRR